MGVTNMINKETLYTEFYYAIKALLSAVSDHTSRYTDAILVDEYNRLVKGANSKNAEILIDFDKSLYFSHFDEGGGEYFNREGIKAHMNRNIAKARAQLDTQSTNVVIDAKDFDFITDPVIKQILERDYQEIQRGVISASWKSVIILCGGSIEAILLDLLQKNTDSIKSSSKIPQESDLTKWTLDSIIDVSVDINIVNSSVGKLSHTIREYRNLIHPGKEKRSNLKVKAEEATIALEVLKMIIRDFSQESHV